MITHLICHPFHVWVSQQPSRTGGVVILISLVRDWLSFKFVQLGGLKAPFFPPVLPSWSLQRKTNHSAMRLEVPKLLVYAMFLQNDCWGEWCSLCIGHSFLKTRGIPIVVKVSRNCFNIAQTLWWKIENLNWISGIEFTWEGIVASLVLRKPLWSCFHGPTFPNPCPLNGFNRTDWFTLEL